MSARLRSIRDECDNGWWFEDGRCPHREIKSAGESRWRCDTPFDDHRIVVRRVRGNRRFGRVVALWHMQMRERSCWVVRFLHMDMEKRGLGERRHQRPNAQDCAGYPHRVTYTI